MNKEELISLEKLGAVIQKEEEILELVLEKLKNKYEILPDEITIIVLMFRKIIEKMDAVFILIENSSEKAAESIARDLLENFLYLKFMLDEKYSKRRALSYYYSHINDQVSFSKLITSKKQESKTLRNFMGIAENKTVLFEIEKRAKHYKEGLDREEFFNIKKEWEYMQRKNKHPKWYSLFKGPKNIRELARMFNFEGEYLTLYRIFSNQVHSTNALAQIEKVGSLAAVRKFRTLDDPLLVMQVSRSIGIQTLVSIINYFAPDETEKLKEWYKDIYKK